MNAVQTLKLDARQRAMLDEMGVKVWWPMPEVVEETPVAIETVAAVEEQAPVSERFVAEAPAPAPAPVARSAPAPAPVSGPAPAAPAVPATHGAAVLIEAPRRLYGDAVDPLASVEGGWLVVADMPPEADGRHGEPFAGDAGKLLDNMLRALKLHDGKTPVHLVRTHRGVAAGQPGSPRPMAEAFDEHAAALAPRVVLAMGPLAAQSLMQSGDPLGKLRGRVVPLASAAGAAVVATYHPAYLLRNPADKARAWADLCLAAEQHTPTPG
ncbi:uracil-DNA glycosylase family protein [Variovorax sp. PAMC26660]|uniref:uracil-DNA glycosylase family protein n=1 Tax=Variovorax sp. PAMC26660 TaxID=2762322 RepID=UPI00164EAF40|nr:uracil-DNA glycosylase family protein [Variovorax sp. PAMC26660]QNK70067.1 uracil-DNA glycosylase [Variovorax sp. PAMC26660]